MLAEMCRVADPSACRRKSAVFFWISGTERTDSGSLVYDANSVPCRVYYFLISVKASNWAFTRYDRQTDRYRSDWSVRRSYRVNASFDRSDRRSEESNVFDFVRLPRSDCRSVWTLRPTGRADRPVGRPITLQRRRYLLLMSYLHSCSCHIHKTVLHF